MFGRLLKHGVLSLVFALCLAVAPLSPVLASAPPQTVFQPPTGAVTYNAPLNEMFFGYGNTGQGWTGGDQAYSVPLTNGSEVWLFSDTPLGSVVNGSRAPFPFTPMIHNCLVVQTGDKIVSTLYQGTHSDPRSLVSPPQAGAWYWFGPGTISGDTLQVIMMKMVATGSGVFAFKWTGTYLAVFSLPSLSLQGVSPLESADGIVWGSWVMQYGGFTYIYGTGNQSTNTMYVARVHGSSLLSQWQYFTGSGWSTDPVSPAGVMSGIESSYSVTRFQGEFLLVSMDADNFFSGAIYAYISQSPTGPFMHKTLLYTTPDATFYDKSAGYGVFTYSAMVHPEFSTGNTLVISYSANGSGPKAFTNVSVYRPRFLNVTV